MNITDYFEKAAQDAKIQGIDFKKESDKKFCGAVLQHDIDEAMMAGDFAHAFLLMEFNKFIQNY